MDAISWQLRKYANECVTAAAAAAATAQRWTIGLAMGERVVNGAIFALVPAACNGYFVSPDEMTKVTV